MSARVKEAAQNFKGTSYVAFEIDTFGRPFVLAIGRLEDDGPIMLYERDHRSVEQGGLRKPLAEFASEDEAARTGEFLKRVGELVGGEK